MKAQSIREAFRQRFCRIGLFAGTCGIVVGLASGTYTTWFLAHSSAAQGTVVSIRAVHNDQENSVLYTPVFTFTARDGQTYTVASDTGSNTSSFAPGQQVPVRYNVSQPTTAKIATLGQLWRSPLVFGSTGVILTALGWLLLLSERRQNPQFKPFGTSRR
jgi:hypothetical protein